jgi:two-component system invasion response regulator UvrY
MILIGLVDDHSITRKGIKALLETNNHFKIIVESDNGKQLLKYLQNSNELPEVLILDISMPDMDGFETINQVSILYPSIKILIFSFYQAEDAILNAVNKGACGFLSKTADPDKLLIAIQSIMKYGFYINDQIKKKYSLNKTSKTIKGFLGKQVLTEKEIQFIRYASSNLTYKEIAMKMNIQPKTLENYRDSLFQKLDINNRAALTLYGIQNGIVQLF